MGVALIVGAVLPLVAGAQAERTCLKCKIKGLVGAMRAGDVDRSLSYLAEDFELHDAAGGQRVDRNAMRGVLQWDAALNGKIAYTALEWEGDRVSGEFTETNDLYGLLAMEPRRYRIEFRFSGDLIREQVYEVLNSDGPSMGQALEPFLEWAGEGHATDLDAIYPDGRFVYSASAANRWIELLQAWRAESKVAAAR
jgi:hypothetical protein